MYSLTTRLPEAQEFDIADAARVLFTPVQDDVDGVDWAGDWEYARDVLRGCTGYAGTAGSSLKNARAACALLEYSLCAQASQLDAAAFAQTIQTAYDALTGEEKEEFAWNMESISSLLALALEDYDAQRPLFETAGISLQAEELMQAERAQEHWTALCGYIAQAMQAQSE